MNQKIAAFRQRNKRSTRKETDENECVEVFRRQKLKERKKILEREKNLVVERQRRRKWVTVISLEQHKVQNDDSKFVKRMRVNQMQLMYKQICANDLKFLGK